jgi:hypothetical protein
MLEQELGQPIRVLLDAPCGTGRFVEFWRGRESGLGVWGLDGSVPMLQEVRGPRVGLGLFWPGSGTKAAVACC